MTYLSQSLAEQRVERDAWLAWLEQLHPYTIELGLERVGSVYRQLFAQKPTALVVTVAGTNGKGSTIALLAQLLHASSISYCAYTSPHLLDFNERIQINGQTISDAELIASFKRVEAARGDIRLTYFEFTTLAALVLFSQSNAQVWLLEVGLGGRLDAVNCIDSDLAIITAIALDHQAWLGDSVTSIAKEKAGILRQGRPVVFGEHHLELLRAAKRLNCPVYDQQQRQFELLEQGWRLGVRLGYEVIYFQSTQWPSIPMPSMVLGLQAWLWLCQTLGIAHSSAAHQQVIEQVALRGRLTELSYSAAEPSIWLDVAHNPAAAELLAQNLERIALAPWQAVVAIMADKDVAGVLKPLLALVERWWIWPLDLPRAMSSKALAEQLQTLGVATANIDSSARSPEQAWQRLRHCHAPIVVFGSFYTVESVYRHLQSN